MWMMSFTVVFCAKIVTLMSGLTSLSSTKLMPAVRDTISSTCFRPASRKSRLTSLSAPAVSTGSVVARAAAPSITLRNSARAPAWLGSSARMARSLASAVRKSLLASSASASLSIRGWLRSAATAAMPALARELTGSIASTRA